MPIGRRSSRKRPKNDLDDYLDEVDSYLFCVTRADRTCLHRDLKAHVKELTLDPSRSEHYEGRYGISSDQLISEIGDPRTLASNYIASVGRKIPSIGLRAYIAILLVIFIGILLAGIDRYLLSSISSIEEPDWIRNTGIALAIGGIFGLGLTVISIVRFQRFHGFIIYIGILALILSIVYSSFISNAIILISGRTTEPILHRTLSLLMMVNFIVIGLIGIYVYLRHFKVMNPPVDLVV